jgi:hypothetical protein
VTIGKRNYLCSAADLSMRAWYPRVLYRSSRIEVYCIFLKYTSKPFAWFTMATNLTIELKLHGLERRELLVGRAEGSGGKLAVLGTLHDPRQELDGMVARLPPLSWTG